MFRITLLALTLLISSTFAKRETCSEFLVWNPATRDTLFAFARKAEDKSTKDGSCYYNSGWTAKVVEWHCQNMYLTQDGKSTFQKDHRGSISLNPYQFFCRSRW